MNIDNQKEYWDVIGKSHRKRLYPAHFISKLSYSDMENSESQVWIDFAFEYEYLNKENYEKLSEKVKEVGKLLNYMILNPEKFGSKRIK